MQAVEFLRFLWAPLLPAPQKVSGSATIWRLSDKSSVHVPLSDLALPPSPEDDEELFEVVGRDDLYAHPGLRALGLEKRGSKRDVVALGAFVLDIDVKSPDGAHKAKGALPASDDDVLAILEAAPEPPTLVVWSGYGYQPWWVLREPMMLASDSDRRAAGRAYEAFEAPFLARAKQLGFHLDSVATIDHQFRLPGSLNAKRRARGEVREVKVVDGTMERFVALLPVSRSKPSESVSSSPPQEGSADLADVRAAMKKLRPDHANKLMIDAVLAGESFAERGSRDDAMYAAASTIAWLTPARRPEMTPKVLAELLRPSLSVWASEPDAEKTLDEEMEKAVQKFESAFSSRHEDDERRFRDAAVIRRALRFRGVEPDEKVVNGSAKQYAVIQGGGVLYVWNFGQQDIPLEPTGYWNVSQYKELFNSCKDLWSNISEGFTLQTFERGKEKNKSDRNIIEEYGTAARRVVGSLYLQESNFEIESRTFFVAMCPRRVSKAERDPDIEEWLALFGASDVEKFLDWVAALPDLERPNSALYVEGAKDVGKDLFASGVAQIWRTNGPADYENIAERFNSEMFSCPFIWLNEGVDNPKKSSAFIRKLVASTSHPCEKKNVDVERVLGAIRFYISANNDSVLTALAGEDLGEKDIDAIAQRFFHVKASIRAAKFLESKKKDLTSWVKDDRIARHVLHLAETRKLETSGRKFIVEGETSEIHRALINRGDRNEVILEWLTSFVMQPKKVTQIYKQKKETPLAAVGDGGVFVNTKAFSDNQTLFRQVDAKHQLLPGVAARILARLSGGRQKRFGDGRERYHEINPERIIEWAKRTQVGNVEDMMKNITGELQL